MELKIFDISSFLVRNNFTHAKLAEKLDCSTSLVSVWASSEQTPSFDKCLKLIELGMTFEEMFGTELTSKARMFLNGNQKEPKSESEFERKVCEILIKYHKSGINGIGQQV